jgi:hypothetical protein
VSASALQSESIPLSPSPFQTQDSEPTASSSPTSDVELRAVVPPQPRNPDESDVNEAARLLDIANDGTFATVPAYRPAGGPLQLTVADGTNFVIDLPGPLGPETVAAQFAPGGEWLAAIDGYGTLWRVDLPDAARPVLTEVDGLVLGRTLAFRASGTLLTTLVDSPESPTQSVIAEIDPATWTANRISDDEHGFQPSELEDGSVVFRSYSPQGETTIRLIQGFAEREIANVGVVAHVDVSPDGQHVAFDRADGGTWILTLSNGPESMRISDGTWPKFSPDSQWISVILDGSTVQLALDGNETLRNSIFAAWVTK